jgi:hypothetical protein
MADLVAWIEGLFEDCSARAPFGIGWDLDRPEPPVTATVTPADCSTAQIVLSRDDVLGRINLAARLQAFLDVELGGPVPPCPVHRVGLTPVRVGQVVHWRCRAGDFQCRVGHYQDALWPPGPDEDPRRIAPMLSRRFSRLRVTGIRSFGVDRRDDRWVAKVRVSPEADAGAVRAAAAPILVEIDPLERGESVRTIRTDRSATETEPAHRVLSLVGVAMPLAALRGRLRRATGADHCDFLVAGTSVRLVPEHQLGPPGWSRGVGFIRRALRRGRGRRLLRRWLSSNRPCARPDARVQRRRASRLRAARALRPQFCVARPTSRSPPSALTARFGCGHFCSGPTVSQSSSRRRASPGATKGHSRPRKNASCATAAWLGCHTADRLLGAVVVDAVEVLAVVARLTRIQMSRR